MSISYNWVCAHIKNIRVSQKCLICTTSSISKKNYSSPDQSIVSASLVSSSTLLLAHSATGGGGGDLISPPPTDDPPASPLAHFNLSRSSSPLYNTCCQSAWPNLPGGDVKNGPTADECLPNGLCQNRGWSSVSGQEKKEWTHFYRVYCANTDWEGCLDVCSEGVCCILLVFKGWES